ncbi:MAG TPA: DUF748 domain-containing protein, partial [Thermodesulfovibrionales bacterium]|nr:DUF748 domain-containing protein [Thermodesulfovibrionales bacterium]
MERVQKIVSALPVRKILAGTLIFLVLFSITGFLVLPPVLKSLLTRQLSKQLHREVTIQKIRVNPFVLSLTVKGFLIKERNAPGPFFSFDELYLNFQGASLVKRGIILSEIRIEKPYVNVVRNEDLSYNFSDLMNEEGAKKPPDSKPRRFSFNNIRIRNGSVDFLDGPKHTKHTVRDMTVAIPFLSNLSYYVESYVQPSFEAKVNNEPVSFKGMSKPFANSHETSFDVNMKDVDIPYYLAYVPFRMNFKVSSASLNTKAMFYFTQYRDKPPTIAIEGDIDFRKVAIADRKGNPLIKFPLLAISIASAEVTSRKVHLSRVALQSPEITLAREKTGKLNVLSLIPEDSAERAADKKKEGDRKTGKESFAVDTDIVQLTDGKISFADRVPEGGFRTTLERIELKVSHLSTEPGKKAAGEVALETDSGERMKLAGEFSLDPLASEGTLEASRIALKKYLPYFEKLVNFRVEDGTLSLGTKYLYQQTGKEPDIRISDFGATLNSLRLRKTDEKEDFLSIPAASVKDLSADLTKRVVVIGDISTQKGTLLTKRYRVGTLLFSTLVRVSGRLEPAAGAAPPQKKEAPPEKPWAVTVKRLLLDRYTITYDDEMPADPVVVTLKKVTVKGENLSNIRKTTGRLAINLRTGEKGSADAAGSVTIEPPSFNLKVTLRDIPILTFQSYFSDLARIIITDGSISSKGTVLFTYAKETGPGAKYRGEISLNHFASVDKAEAEDFLKWDSLHIGAMDISYAPFSATIGEVALSDFYARVIINPDGSINLQNIREKTGAAGEGQPAPEPDAGAAEAPAGGTAVEPSSGPSETGKKIVKIDTVTLQGGTVDLSDHYIKPNFATNMREIGGRVTGLSSEETKMADVELRGRLENYAPLEITGRVNPLRDDLFIDLNVTFRDMDLSALTPYSGKYLGYTIEKGKVALNLHYLIEKKKLDAQNKIVLDQFTLGSHVDSPNATKLPVKLAVALLKNRRGEIDLDVPVSGQIDDPKFSLGRIILKILVNLLVKAATSPFALLGALFGGGEELSYVEFDPGMHDLNAEGIKKLDTLLKALNDRPSLKLDLEGHADPENDREGLKQYLFNQKVKAQKVKDLVKKGGETVSVDEVRVEPAEYPKYLKAAYKEEKFPKPRNFIGIAKDLPVPEMEKLMLTNIVVKDDDLRQLASQRALEVKDYILKSKQVEPERVFLIEPKSIQPEKKEKVKDSRVDFK